MPQQSAWLATVVLVLLVAGVFLRVTGSASVKADYDPIANRATNLRPRLLLLFAGVVLVVFWFTLRRLPYESGGPASQVVEATGTQWAWQLSRDTLIAGAPTEFQVTSTDVNHGFGIYDARHRLLAQVQAMPKYVNRLRYTFGTPGTYHVLCLEYCGMLHHSMMRDLIVTSAAVTTGGVR
jgi:cytochrome c oxidase subunit II